VEDYDYVFVCVGDFQDSLVIVDYLKELGANYIIAKASSIIHEKFLMKNGADRVVYPEKDMAYRCAVEYSNRNIYDFIKLSDDTGIYEIEAPSSWCGKTLLDLNVRKIHNVSVIAIKDANGCVTAIRNADYRFNKSEHIIVMGEKKDVSKITKE
jgi:trk system potassium uptake protein TrkA